MKQVYPVVFTETPSGYVAHVPDFDIDTQGGTLAEAIEMARDAIGLVGIDRQDDGKTLPVPSPAADVSRDNGDIVSLVDIDFSAYRRANEMRTVRKNVTLPSWLNDAAEKSGVNFSATLQSAIKQQLHLD